MNTARYDHDVAHFRDELRAIPDLEARARRLVQIERECDVELKQIRLRLVRDMAARGLSMSRIGEAFGVSRARAHQMVHERMGPAPKQAQDPAA